MSNQHGYQPQGEPVDLNTVHPPKQPSAAIPGTSDLLETTIQGARRGITSLLKGSGGVDTHTAMLLLDAIAILKQRVEELEAAQKPAPVQRPDMAETLSDMPCRCCYQMKCSCDITAATDSSDYCETHDREFARTWQELIKLHLAGNIGELMSIRKNIQELPGHSYKRLALNAIDEQIDAVMSSMMAFMHHAGLVQEEEPAGPEWPSELEQEDQAE